MFNQMLNLALAARRERTVTGSYGSKFQEMLASTCDGSNRGGIGSATLQALVYLAFNDPVGFVRCRAIEASRR